MHTNIEILQYIILNFRINQMMTNFRVEVQLLTNLDNI